MSYQTATEQRHADFEALEEPTLWTTFSGAFRYCAVVDKCTFQFVRPMGVSTEEGLAGLTRPNSKVEPCGQLEE